MKSSIVLFLILLAVISLSMPATAEYEPELHITIRPEYARTYDSVLVMVFSDPILYDIIGDGLNNTTIASNHTIQLTFTNLGTGELIHSQNLTLAGGVATWNFKVDPNWGEFTGVVKVVDAELNIQRTESVDIVYSTDWVMAMMNNHDSEERELDRISNLKVAQTTSNTVLMTIIGLGIFTFITLIRVQHSAARKNNQESLWDRFQNKIWPFDESTSAETMYLTDKHYTFPAHGKIFYEAESIYQDYLDDEVQEGEIAYKQAVRREQLRKIDPILVKEITDPNVSLEDLKNEMNKQVEGET